MGLAQDFTVANTQQVVAAIPTTTTTIITVTIVISSYGEFGVIPD